MATEKKTEQQTEEKTEQPKVALTVDLVNGILGYLDQRPHREVRSLIDGILAQTGSGPKPAPGGETGAAS